MLALEDKWVWDSWYCHDGDRWHAFFLQADKVLGDPELRHWNVTHGHAVSDDLTNWRYEGTVFGPAAAPAFDDLTTWTGCVLRDDAGLWHLFYTGTCRAEDGKIQRIGHATSRDLASWTRVGLAVERAGPKAGLYEGFVPDRWKDCSLRDPWVMRDPAGDGWLMFFTARSPAPADTNASGAIGLARSPDLTHWTLGAPVFVGGFGEIEVPQVFERGGRWYCLFCTTALYWSDAYRVTYPGAPVSGIHYLTADHPLGPWRVAPGPFLDGTPDCDRYAGRRLVLDGRDVVLAFNRGRDADFAGTLTDPMPLEAEPDGRLRLETRPGTRS